MKRLAVAVAIGILIDLERGWRERESLAGHNVAGVRTFALLALAGTAAGLLCREAGLAAVLVLAAVAGLVDVVAVALSLPEGAVALVNSGGALALPVGLGLAAQAAAAATCLI